MLTDRQTEKQMLGKNNLLGRCNNCILIVVNIKDLHTTVLHEVLPENLHKKHTIIMRHQLRTFESLNELWPRVVMAAVIPYVFHRIQLYQTQCSVSVLQASPLTRLVLFICLYICMT